MTVRINPSVHVSVKLDAKQTSELEKNLSESAAWPVQSVQPTDIEALFYSSSVDHTYANAQSAGSLTLLSSSVLSTAVFSQSVRSHLTETAILLLKSGYAYLGLQTSPLDLPAPPVQGGAGLTESGAHSFEAATAVVDTDEFQNNEFVDHEFEGYGSGGYGFEDDGFEDVVFEDDGFESHGPEVLDSNWTSWRTNEHGEYEIWAPDVGQWLSSFGVRVDKVEPDTLVGTYTLNASAQHGNTLLNSSQIITLTGAEFAQVNTTATLSEVGDLFAPEYYTSVSNSPSGIFDSRIDAVSSAESTQNDVVDDGTLSESMLTVL